MLTNDAAPMRQDLCFPLVAAVGRIIRRCVATLAFISFASAGANADVASVWGTIYHCPADSCSTRSSDRVLLNSVSTGQANWFGPAFTDDQGVFAFYNLPDGAYVLHIYDPKNGHEVWRQRVSSPKNVAPVRLPQ